MEVEKDNVNINRQNRPKEESTLESKHDQSNNTNLIVSNENEVKQIFLNTTTESTNNALSYDTVLNNTSVGISESLLTDEHSYANVNNECPDENQKSTIIENNISEELMHTETLSVDLLNVAINNGNKMNENYHIVENNDILPIVSNEVVITEEIITVESSKMDNSCTSNKTFDNTNSCNKSSDNKPADLFYIDNRTSLAAIAAQYDSSDSEVDNSENANDVSNVNNYRNKDEVMLSSDESSDSESDSSSSDSVTDSDTSSLNKSKDSDDSDDENKVKKKSNNSKKVFKPKSEFDDLPPIEDLKISVPEVLCDPLGEVAWTVEQMVVVRPKPGKPTLNLDTVLFIDKGQRALGHIFDVFGQVAEPHYCVRFNSSDHIQKCDIKVGMTVYYCPNTPYTSLVFLSELTKMKAVDDIGDDEPPQFSDDEEEQAYFASIKNKANNNKLKDSANERPNKRRRGNKSGWQSNHPWNSNREHPQNVHPGNSRPFYRTQHPWSRPRQQHQNPWHQYNSYPNNQWMGQYPQYNEVQPYNEYLGPPQIQPMEMQNIRFQQMQWNPHYPLPHINPVQVQRFPQALVPSFTIPPPPPPPPPNADT